MKPVETPECNFVYVLPGGTSDSDLPCLVTDTTVTSFWRPEDEYGDADRLARGATLRLRVWGYAIVSVGFELAELKALPLGKHSDEHYDAEIPITEEQREAVAIGGKPVILRVHQRPTPPTSIIVQ